VGHHEATAVEDEVGDQPVAELLHLRAELIRLLCELGQGRLQPVAHLHLASPQRPDQLVLVVAGDAPGVPGGHHAHHQPQHARGVGATVDQVADEHGRTSRGRCGVDGPAVPVVGQGVAQPGQQGLELLPAPVHVPDHVERSVLVPVVVEQPFPYHDGPVHRLDAAQHVDLAEALLVELPEGAAELVALPADHRVAEVAVCPAGVAVQADPLGQVEHDGHRQHVVVAGQGDQLAPGLRLHVGRVDHGQPPRPQPGAGDVVQHVEGVGAGRLVVLVVGDQAAAEVAGQHLEAAEVAAGEGRLARAAGADQADQ
jgi:hypothetical protein